MQIDRKLVEEVLTRLKAIEKDWTLVFEISNKDIIDDIEEVLANESECTPSC